MLVPHIINQKDNFIGGWYMKDNSICSDLIDLFEFSEDKKIGVLGLDEYIDKTIKNSTDLCVESYSQDPIIKNYLKILQEVINQYKKQYIYSDKLQQRWGISEGINIQKYKPTQGYYAYHYERTGHSKRILAFITYLNTIKDGGGTEFFYQQFKTKAEKGLTIICPAEWTHTHRGVISNTETKYIITGWFSYL